MQKRYLPVLSILMIFLALLANSCSKLDTTDLGADLLPAVDNIHTFDTTLVVNTTQGAYLNDTTPIARTEDHVLGRLSNDPLFGNTTASIYLQLKPGFFPYYIDNYDSINAVAGHLDSVVLCLNYKGVYGDSSIPLVLQAYGVANNNTLWDSVFTDKSVSFTPNITSPLSNPVTVDVRTLHNFVKFVNGKDSSNNQVRIKLFSSFANSLYAQDSLNGAFKNDSSFRAFQNGFAIKALSGNLLMYSNLTDAGTRLELHYRKKNAGHIDTIYTSFRLNANFFGTTTSAASSTCNNIIRSWPSAITSPVPGADLYLQTGSPGTYANLSVPGISGLPNMVVHRAEVIIQQAPPFNPLIDNINLPPNYLYLDLKDTSSTTDKWKPIYFDLNPTTFYNPDNAALYYPGAVDYGYFGGFVRNKLDPFGNPIKYYNINITRHVQQIVTKHTPNYQMRLMPANKFVYPQYYPSYISYGNGLAYGRIKVGSGTNPNYKLKLHIIYSKL